MSLDTNADAGSSEPINESPVEISSPEAKKEEAKTEKVEEVSTKESSGKTGESSTEEKTTEPNAAEITGESALAALKAKKKKKKIDPKDIIKTPNVHDVLLGRGKPFQNHEGNQSMLQIVDMFRKRYHESERAFKHEIIEEVLDIIKSKGGRFLERIDDFEKSYWSEVPHRMSYRKVGHAFRSNARRISMEKRGLAANQRRNAAEMARASMMSQFMNNNDNLMQRMAPLPDMMSAGGSLGLTDSIGFGNSILNDTNSLSASMYRQGAGASLSATQRELLAHEQMLHSTRIERILGNGGTALAGTALGGNTLGGSTLGGNALGTQHGGLGSMLGGGDSLSFGMGGANLAERSLQLNNMRRMMLLGSGAGMGNQQNAYQQLLNAGGDTGSRRSDMGLGNLGDSSFKLG